MLELPRFAFRVPRVPAEDAFALVEVMVAALVLAMVVSGLVVGFDSARRVSLVSERRTAMAHRAQLEIERLQTYPYSQLAMFEAPSHSAETNNPDYYVKTACGTHGCYAWNAENTGEEESIVTSAKEKECVTTAETECGRIAASPTKRKCSEKAGACEWSDGTVEGNVYDFVTWHSDGNCGSECPSKENYKRLTVVVTVKVPHGVHETTPLRVSTFVTEKS